MVVAEELEQVYRQAERWSAKDVLRWAFATYGTGVAIASAFGTEGMVTIDLAASISPRLRVFTLDTGYLFPETCKLMKQVERRYGLRVTRLLPSLTPQMQAGIHGADLWNRDPESCCRMRKVEPLQQHLSQLQAWITAIRRDQTPARAQAGKVEWDSNFNLVKVNPLADWTAEMVWAYIRSNHLPYNPMHDQGYPSIGCTHCTRPVMPGEPVRAGRWPGSAKTECGLHRKGT